MPPLPADRLTSRRLLLGESRSQTAAADRNLIVMPGRNLTAVRRCPRVVVCAGSAGRPGRARMMTGRTATPGKTGETPASRPQVRGSAGTMRPAGTAGTAGAAVVCRAGTADRAGAPRRIWTQAGDGAAGRIRTWRQAAVACRVAMPGRPGRAIPARWRRNEAACRAGTSRPTGACRAHRAGLVMGIAARTRAVMLSPAKVTP
jgi:hypothetical protein